MVHFAFDFVREIVVISHILAGRTPGHAPFSSRRLGANALKRTHWTDCLGFCGSVPDNIGNTTALPTLNSGRHGGWVEPQLDAGEALGFAVAHRDQIRGGQTLWLFQHAGVSDHQHQFGGGFQLLQPLVRALAQIAHDVGRCPLGGAQDVRQSLGAGGGPGLG